MASRLREYRLRLHWSTEELGRRAGVSSQTVKRIERGFPAYPHTAQAILDALSLGYGREITKEEVGITIRGE
jgi:transcriptional regulator with XRE-family HTH domain